MSYLTRAIGAVKLFTTAHAPTIMVTGGVVSMTAGAVIGAHKTLQVEAVLEKHVPDLEKIKKGESLGLESYGEDAARSDRIKVYSRVGLDLGKLYVVPGVLFVGGAVLVFGGHRLLLQRNATLALAFTGLKKSFDAYRARVVDQWGSEADQAMMGGYVLSEEGPEGETTTVANRDWDSSDLDPYNRVFSRENSTQWQDDLGVNKNFIANQQRFAQITLGLQGHLYLSDVYEALGFEETSISRVTGWKVTKHPDGTKNIPVVDFGLDKPHRDDWKYGQNKEIYLDFNCQGLIVGGKVQKALEAAR
jgi:hypothetical protein